jgi:hypothetical protein
MIAEAIKGGHRAQVREAVAIWSQNVSELISSADDQILSVLFGAVEAGAARQMAGNPRLQSSIARLASKNGFPLPPISTIDSHESVYLEPETAKKANLILQAGLTLTAFGPVIDKEQRKTVIVQYSEALVQALWLDGAKFLACLSVEDLSEIRALPEDDRADVVSAYLSARGMGGGQKAMPWSRAKIPFSALDAAFDALKTSVLLDKVPNRTNGLAA